MMVESLLVRQFRLILLPVEDLLSDDEFLVKLFDLLRELIILLLHLLVLHFFGAPGNRVHL